MPQRLAALWAYRTDTRDQSIALGNSREPPAFTFPSRSTQSGKMSPGLEAQVKAAPLQWSAHRAPDPWILAPLFSLYSFFDNAPPVLLAFPNPTP